MQIVRGELVHQEADGAAMHAVDRLAGAHVVVQRLQHQTVAAERDNDISLVRVVIAVDLHQLLMGSLRFRAVARNEGDPVEALGRGHGGDRELRLDACAAVSIDRAADCRAALNGSLRRSVERAASGWLPASAPNAAKNRRGPLGHAGFEPIRERDQ